jgi:hypothetical protein
MIRPDIAIIIAIEIEIEIERAERTPKIALEK